MKTQQVELFIQAVKYNWEDNFSLEVNVHEHQTDKTTVYITVDKKVMEVQMPELDEKSLTLAHVEQIRVQIKAEKAASYLRVTQMEEHISSLMCIENKE